MNKIITILSAILFFTNTLFSQKEKLPDTIYVAVFGSTVLIADIEYHSPSVNLITTNFIFTKKKPEVVYYEYSEQGDVDIYWSHSRQIVNGDDTRLIYSEDIIDEKSIKNSRGRVYGQILPDNSISYHKKKPNSKKFEKSLNRYLKKWNKRDKKKKN